MRTFVFSLIGAIPLLLGGCEYKLGYRHFASPILPVTDPEQTSEFTIGDDHSITFFRDRLEANLLPLTVDMLNRQFPAYSNTPKGFAQPNPYTTPPTNPFTYGDWSPAGQDQKPVRFTVFRLRIKNYAFPKVRVDPARIELVAANGRRYQALSFTALIEYHWPYAIAFAGNTYKLFKEREALLRQNLFKDGMIFSGREQEGYIVFPALDFDVEELTVWIKGMALRFDYRDEPVETIDIPYRFRREVYMARQPRVEEN